MRECPHLQPDGLAQLPCAWREAERIARSIEAVEAFSAGLWITEAGRRLTRQLGLIRRPTWSSARRPRPWPAVLPFSRRPYRHRPWEAVTRWSSTMKGYAAVATSF
jgi:hypothetical protein